MSEDAFLEVFFQAEVTRMEYPDIEEIARRNCNEHAETRQKKIEELRSMIIERAQCHPRRMDDAYLLMFLRCRRFVIPLAHKMVIRYEEHHRRYKDSLYNCDIFNLDRVFNKQYVYVGTLPESPYTGRTLIMRIGRWDPSSVAVQNVLQAGVAMTEMVLQQPRLQVMGVSIIVDLEGFELSKIKYFTPEIAHQAVSLMGVNLPILIHGIHFINYSWLISTIFRLSKPFIPSGGDKYVHFHGYDMTSLHKYIDPAHLPKEYGGHCTRVITFQEWISSIRKYAYRDQILVQELRDIGYIVQTENDECEKRIWLDDDTGWIIRKDRRDSFEVREV